MTPSGFACRGLDPDKAIETLDRADPRGRIEEPADVADVIGFLVSGQARHIAADPVEVTGAKPISD